jgi:hypothetical protein
VDGQPVEPGAELPLLARIGKACKRAEPTATRRDGTVVSWRATLGLPEPGELPREDQVHDWRPAV